MLLPGVYQAQKKDGTPYYRSSITYRSKHISLGSYDTEEAASSSYREARELLDNKDILLCDYKEGCYLSFHKWVVLINFREHGMYLKNPIYLKNRYFLYYLDQEMILKFDIDDLFFYAEHKIMRRGGYLFVSDYGMQINILSRYGIKNFSVVNRDYRFVNGDETDYRYDNIEVINRYYGVTRIKKSANILYLVKIHVKGDLIVGKYTEEIHAAIAYNKAAHILRENGCQKQFLLNYIVELDETAYTELYHKIKINETIRNWQG